MKRILTVITGAALLAVDGWAGAEGFTVTKDGKPACSIIIAKDARKAARFAAAELQAHVRQITGAELPVATDGAAPEGAKILVGESALTRAMGLDNGKFGDQEYLVRVTPQAVALIGRDKDDQTPLNYDLGGNHTWPSAWDQQGTMYAVYDFLEKCCGVKWLTPFEGGTILPTTTSLAATSMDLRRKPFFEYRDTVGGAPAEQCESWQLYPGSADENAASYQAFDKLAFERLHQRFTDAGGYRATGLRGTYQLFNIRHKTGGRKAHCNHSLNHFYDLYWKPNKNVEEYFIKKRPELFAKGYEGIDYPPQMCYSSRELVELVAQEACDYFDKGGYQFKKVLWQAPIGAKWGTDFFAVEPMDNSSFCKCPECQKWLAKTANAQDGQPAVFSNGRYSEYFFNFVNEVAKLVRKKHPDKWVVTLAYASHAVPPSFKLEPNVAVQFCFAANRMPYDLANYGNELKLLDAWVAHTRENRNPLYLWLYYTFPAAMAGDGKFHCFPGFFAHTIGKQFDMFKDKGYRGFFHCGYGQEVEAYVTYKLMDDPALRVDDLLDEYFTGLYGKAGKPLREFYELVEKTYCDPANYPPRSVHQNVGLAWVSLGTTERVARLGELMAKAKTLADTDIARRNVQLFELSTWNYILEGKRGFELRRASPIPKLDVPAIPAASGDPAKADWSKAVELDDRWYEGGTNRLSLRKFSGHAAHDGQFLYLELTDDTDSSKLTVSANVAPFDDWELFIAAQRALPYRQILVGPKGAILALMNGEINWRMYVPWLEHGVNVVNETINGRWVTKMAIPLASLTKDGVKPGGKFHMNIVRVMSPAAAAADKCTIDSWVSGCTVHDVDRLAEVRLQ